jgi:hypothetical protein
LEAGKQVSSSNYFKIQMYSLAVAGSIIIFNECGRLALLYFVEEERHPTQSKVQREKVFVITIFKFANAAIVPMVAQ